MKTRYVILLLVGLVTSFIVGYRVRRACEKNVQVERDTVVDTLRTVLPVPSFEIEVGEVEIPYPIIIKEKGQDKIDTIYVPVPVTQKEYKTDDYRLLISGCKPNLDYIEVYHRTEQIIRTVQPRRFGIGLIGGFGVGKHGLSPYVGVGGFYRIW